MKLRRGATHHAEEAAAPVAPRPEPKGPRIGEILLGREAVGIADLDAALGAQAAEGGRLGEILVARGVVDERTVINALAEQFGLRVIDLSGTSPTPEALAAIDGGLARELRALPLAVIDHKLAVAFDDIPTGEALDRLTRRAGVEIAIVLAPPSDLTRTIDRSYRALEGVEQIVQAFETDEGTRSQVAAAASAEAIRVDVNAPVAQVVTRLLTEAAREGASDIHLEPLDGAVRVRFRVDGALYEPLKLPGSMAQALVSRIKIMADMNIVEKRRAQDGNFEYTADGRTLDVRVATVATIWGEKVVMRILDRSKSLHEVATLGMPPATAEQFSQAIRAPFGMVICAGPTGSGKTTTLYAALNEINDPERNIMTIEDPVEYVFPTINQIEINETAEITFAGGLKAILRQDPDVILVGEIRDVETARIAVQSALTGHLVLSSLHATDAAAALQRFTDMGIESFLIASSVEAVVGQRLVRRICAHCTEEYEPHADELAFYEASGGHGKEVFVHGAGCNFCNGTGFSDRIGVFELMHVSDEIKELLVQQAPREKIQAVAVSQGMHTLRDEGIRLVEQDVTTISEVLRRIYAL
jgi:type IV pilus assembly protein PilB